MASTTHPIRFGIQTPQQHGSWQELLSLWRELDTLGFDSGWVFDHFLPIVSDPTGPCLEGWTALAALAMATQKLRLGVMVTGNTYRHPAVLAKMAATVDIISGGRVILGMGAGWFQQEHSAYGITFPKLGERLARLDEALEIIKRLWTEEKATFAGQYYQLTDAPFQPRPEQTPHPPILIGATGEKVALKIVAHHADMWNMSGTPEVCRHKIEVLTQHCQRAGRNPDTIEKSVLISKIEKSVLVSTPLDSPDVRKQIEGYLATGMTHMIFTLIPPYDRHALRRFAQEVMPTFR